MSKISCLTVSHYRKISKVALLVILKVSSVSDFFLALSICRVGRFWWSIKRGYQKRMSENFYLQNVHDGVLLCLWKLLLSKNYAYHNFSSEIFCMTIPKITWGALLCCWKFLISKNFLHKRGYYNLSSKIFRLTEPKIFVEGNIWCLWVLPYAWHRLHLRTLK